MSNVDNQYILNPEEKKTYRNLRNDLNSEHQMLKEEITEGVMSSEMKRYR